MTQARIEPATFRFVAQHLDHCATTFMYGISPNTINKSNSELVPPYGRYFLSRYKIHGFSEEDSRTESVRK